MILIAVVMVADLCTKLMTSNRPNVTCGYELQVNFFEAVKPLLTCLENTFSHAFHEKKTFLEQLKQVECGDYQYSQRNLKIPLFH